MAPLLTDRHRLRAALWDACSQCAYCGGAGVKFLVGGGTVACVVCSPWRKVLRETRPSIFGWLKRLVKRSRTAFDRAL